MRCSVACAAFASAFAVACAPPLLAPDGTLVIPQSGARGASVLTANGLRFRDRVDVPRRIVVRDPYEPWRAPVGFLVPASGRFTRTSHPTVVAAPGLVVSLRASDERVPSWGGEMLVRVDVRALAVGTQARWGEDVAIVIDGRGPDTMALASAALDQLGDRDRVVVVDAAGSKMVVPAMPASNHSLVAAAVEHRLAAPISTADHRSSPAEAVARALGALTEGTPRRILVLSDEPTAAGDVDSGAARGLGDALVPIAVVATTGAASTRGERLRAVQQFVPASGAPAFGDVVLRFEASPAPSHVLEASGGDARWLVEGGELALGDVRAGDERTEVLRVTVPPWTPGEPYVLHVAARFDDLQRGGPRNDLRADMTCVYDDDLERLADSRHGDVIAYASALATLARLDAAFTSGSSAVAPDISSVARMHARSLALLARDQHDPAAAAQAAMLEALLGD